MSSLSKSHSAQVGIIIAIAVALVNSWALAFSSAWVAVASGALYCFYITHLLRWRPWLVVLLLPFLYLRATEFMSFIAIEFGAWMTESVRAGSASGGSARYLALNLAVFTFIGLLAQPVWAWFRPAIARMGDRRSTAWGEMAYFMAVVLTCALVGVLILTGLTYGFPALSGAERFGFRRSVSGWIFIAILNHSLAISLCLGYFMCFRRRRPVILPLYIAFLALMVLFGGKQTDLSLQLIAFVTPIALLTVARQGRLPIALLVKLLMVVVAITTPAVLFSYGFASDPQAAFMKTGMRIALQGQLWHLADLEVASRPMLFDEHAFSAEMADLFLASFRQPQSVGYEYGLYSIMGRYAERDMLESYFINQLGFIFALYPAWLTLYGWPVTVGLALFSGLVWVLLCAVLMAAMAREAYLAMPIFGLVYAPHLSAHIDGMSYRLFGLQPLLLLGTAWLFTFLPAFELSSRSPQRS